MQPKAVVKHLIESRCPHFNDIPKGLKQNIFFTINNSYNVERRKNDQCNDFYDVCVAWKSQRGPEQTWYEGTPPM